MVSVPKYTSHCTRLSKKVIKCHHIVKLIRLYLKKAHVSLFEPFCLCTKMSCTLYQIIQKGHKLSVHSQVVSLSNKLLVYGKKQTIKPWSDVVMSVPKCLAYCTLKSNNVSTHCPVLTLCMKKKYVTTLSRIYSLSEKKIPIFCCLNLFVSVPKCLTHCTRLSKKVTKCHHIVEELLRLYLKKSRCLIV